MRRVAVNEHSPCRSIRGTTLAGLSARSTGQSDGAIHKTFNEAMRNRRTSLPATSLTKILPGSSNISEARGLIADMLASDSNLPSNVTSCLRAVATLLNPHTQLAMHDFQLPSVEDNPYSGEQFVVNSSSKTRVSNVTFSTVTSATGLPTISAEPSRARSSRCESYWKPESSDARRSNASTSNEKNAALQKKESLDRRESGSLADAVVITSDGTQFDRNELESDKHLQGVSEWSLPIFELAERFPRTILSRLTYSCFKQAELFRIFKVPPIKFFNFFHALENGYWDIPYHNRIHAADVLHACFYLTQHPVRPLFGPTTSPDSLLPPPTQPASSLAASMSSLELMALYTAAAMHDYDHPGRTNAFLVAVEDRKAILYNDRSVLENHHAAESWRLLCCSENNFIESLDAAETKRFRYLVLEYILSTDLKQHFEIIMTFNDKTNDMDLTNEADRLLIAKALIKMADINSPTKPFSLHRQWTTRICDEFYLQGDDERVRGMAITPYMDRSDAQIAKLQDSFIAHLVSPLALALNEAGLLPVLPGLVEPEIMINLNHNHKKWLHEIECTKPQTNGVIEEESSSESAELKRSISLDSQ